MLLSFKKVIGLHWVLGFYPFAYLIAFALLDVARNQIHLARDPLGKKPLFFRWSDNELAFASSARALKTRSASRRLSSGRNSR